ncbi:MAG: urate hydroxylase PuuD [Paracoccaceae bacterium]|nr:urate hydroxylase PuuD [Paracoccaceae bacterium]
MYDYAVFMEWVSFAARWLHVITAFAWIGSSFYFIALDLSLRKASDLPEGAGGEEWQVHGGGFYQIQKYLVAPAEMPEHLTWFKWESYATWLSGFALMALVYYGGAELYLVDPNVRDMSAWTAILISLGSIGLGWLAYDLICKSPFGTDNTRLMLLLYVILVAMAWGYAQVFTGRAAFLHLGAFTATIMTANVFLIIIPNQKIVVADLKTGRKPDSKYGEIAKQRSTHNNYLTLPVIFLMLSNHNPLAFGTEYAWAIASLVFLMGVTIRHYFNTIHARAGNPTWTWAATAVIFILIVWLSTVSKSAPEGDAEMSPAQTRFAMAPGFEAVHETVLGRCSMCHAAEPFYEGILWPPKGVVLETSRQVAAHAREIYLQSGRSHAMPPANVSFMEEAERAAIVAWYEGALAEGF